MRCGDFLEVFLSCGLQRVPAIKGPHPGFYSLKRPGGKYALLKGRFSRTRGFPHKDFCGGLTTHLVFYGKYCIGTHSPGTGRGIGHPTAGNHDADELRSLHRRGKRHTVQGREWKGRLAIKKRLEGGVNDNLGSPVSK
jgi:hypothetical protein